MVGDKGKDIAQSPEFTRVQNASLGPAAHYDVPQGGAVIGAVLAEAEAALDAGDAERARRLIAVVRELQALGMGPRGTGGTGR